MTMNINECRFTHTTRPRQTGKRNQLLYFLMVKYVRQNRAMKRCEKFFVNAQARVAMLQKAAIMEILLVRLHRSTKMAAGKEARIFPVHGLVPHQVFFRQACLHCHHRHQKRVCGIWADYLGPIESTLHQAGIRSGIRGAVKQR